MDEAPPPQGRSGLMTALLLIGGAVVVGLVVGGMMIVFLREPAPPPTAGVSGFDVAEVPRRPEPSAAFSAAAPPAPAPSSLGMVVAGAADAAAPGQAPAAAPKTPVEQAAMSFTDAIRGSEKILGDIARAYTDKYPSIRQYGKDWMSHPDLKKLNDDYMRNHDPIAFLRGLSSSQSFPQLVQKYSGEPAVQNFLKDCFTKAPPGAVGASMDYINKDKTLDSFISNVAGQAGLPPALLNPTALAAGMQSPADIEKMAQDAAIRQAGQKR